MEKTRRNDLTGVGDFQKDEMTKPKTIELHPKDLFADIVEHPNIVVGAWIKILCKIWLNDNGGKLVVTLEQAARIIGEGQKETERVLAYLGSEDIAVITRHGKQITIINRRTARDSEAPLAVPPSLLTKPTSFTLKQCQDVGFTIGLTDKDSEAAFVHFDMQGWLRKNGMPITSLHSCMVYWRNHGHEFKTADKSDKSTINTLKDYK